MQEVVFDRTNQRFEADCLQNHIAAWIGNDRLSDPIPAFFTCIREPIAWNTRRDWRDGMICVPLLLGKELQPIADQQPQISSVGLVDERKIDFIEDAV